MTTFTAKLNRQARQWDVVTLDGEIQAMFGGGKRGKAEAERMAQSFTWQTGGAGVDEPATGSAQP